jgi:hypothetical protein
VGETKTEQVPFYGQKWGTVTNWRNRGQSPIKREEIG